jgi:hypothetical protein
LNSYAGALETVAAAARALAVLEPEPPLPEVTEATRRLARPVLIDAGEVLLDELAGLVVTVAPGSDAASKVVFVRPTLEVRCWSAVAE